LDLRGVFNSEPKSLFDTVSDAGLCFYLPAYQRPYSWNNKNIERVFEDVIHGIENSIRNEDAITFIGTLLTIHDTKFETIVPHKKGEVPSKVMLVIDGQQRLTTMLLIMTVLHDHLKNNEEKLNRNLNKLQKLNQQEIQEKSNEEINNLEWILDKLTQEVANLRYFSTDTNSNRDKVYRWYPKLIRAYKDCWSKVEVGAEYESPIARYLHQYNKHVLQCQETEKYLPFSYQVNKEHPEYDSHQIVLKNLITIRSKIKKICGCSSDANEENLPSITDLAKGKFGSSFQFDIPDALLKNIEDEENKLINETLKLIVFSKYLLQRVCVTYVTVTDETYAFDMFEALNTTGEPLTSIETFKPKVIEEEGLSNFESSESKKYFDIIDSHLDSISDANKKHKQTTRLMLAFALSETGEKISKHISDQRRYLIDSYRDQSPEVKKGFVKNLAFITKFYYDEWDQQDPKILNNQNDEANIIRLCLDVLRESKHEITVPLIARFYNLLIDTQQNQYKEELLYCLKSIVAFFVLWRASHQSTAGIDTVYRDILRIGEPKLGISSFSRRGTQDGISAKTLSLIFREKLMKKLNTTEDDFKTKWLQSATKIPVYSISKPLSRIMMLAAFHDTCPDRLTKGFIEAGTRGSNTMLSWHKWSLFSIEDKLTIEHVAPQEMTDEWDSSLFENQELIHSIGNLTILPASTNSSASNKSWNEKKKYFHTLCQENKQQKDKLLKDLPEKQKRILSNSQYLGYLEPLSQVEDWNADFIMARSKNLLSFVWDRFEPWLDFRK